MKGLVLSGGKGTRLRPITHTSAKQLVPVANKPILFYGLEAIAKSDIKEVGIVVGDTKNEIKSAVGDGSKFGLKITYIEQEAPLGLAHAVKISQDFLKDDDFVMYLGDNLIKDGIKTFVDKFREKKPNSQILLAKVPNPQQFGVAELKDGKVINLVEKPKQPKSDLALVGVYMFDKNIFEAVNNIKPSLRGELEITDAIQYLVNKKYNVLPHVITGWWKDTGKLEDMLEANRIILDTLEAENLGKVENSSMEGKVVLQKNSEIKNSTIRGPVIIGENCKIVNSYIGPFTSVYFNTIVENSEIEHSIVLENSKIKDVKRIEDSLIGQNVEILRSEKKPHAYRIMVGDSSRIEIA
ncbi:MAG: glucose-1-phosphate thymidylyltransferase [Elusimicrobia bacterium RIFOXYD2_FULL_34_15]|nr:MAG: glucose-1-phosphate thymidylyltransferase [Elusimicrobia bacterium RIFOXYD2_FULL_34_15]